MQLLSMQLVHQSLSRWLAVKFLHTKTTDDKRRVKQPKAAQELSATCTWSAKKVSLIHPGHSSPSPFPFRRTPLDTIHLSPLAMLSVLPFAELKQFSASG